MPIHLERAREGARFVLIDEFQDSNVAQIELTRLLAGEPANVFAVGDPDQAIYRFRGATAGAFDHFLKSYGLDTSQARDDEREPTLDRSNPEICLLGHFRKSADHQCRIAGRRTLGAPAAAFTSAPGRNPYQSLRYG